MVKNREVGFNKPEVCGTGSFIAPNPMPLTCNSMTNTYVGWIDENGSSQCGVLESWDGDFAVINSNGTVLRINCTKL